MTTEYIKEIGLNEKNQVYLKLESQGSPSYQHIYREAKGVNWNNEEHQFESTPLNDWSVSKWCKHIMDTTKSCSIKLIIPEEVEFKEVSESDIKSIKEF